MIFEAERGSHMPETESPGLMNDRVRSLIGRSSPVREMYGTVDVETVRRYIVGIPDQDPRHWDPSAAGTRFGSTTTPAVMLHYIAGRQAPWLPDTLHDVMAADPFNDTGYAPSDEGDGLPSIRSVAATRSHLHAGDQIEVLQYPKIGDRVFYQSRWVDIEEKTGRDGRPFLLVTHETRYWNQDDQVLLLVRGVGIERP